MNLKSWIKRSLIALGIVGAVGGLAVLTAKSGIYDVGATDKHVEPVEWMLRATMEASVREHAKEVRVPSEVNVHDADLAAKAIGHYSVACASCHGAPGADRAPWMVLYPEPALLTDAKVVDRWSDAELYWIIKHGIKDTGMIALGPTHAEADLWAVTAFVRQLPTMPVERYRSLVAAYQAQHAGHANHQ